MDIIQRILESIKKGSNDEHEKVSISNDKLTVEKENSIFETSVDFEVPEIMELPKSEFPKIELAPEFKKEDRELTIEDFVNELSYESAVLFEMIKLKDAPSPLCEEVEKIIEQIKDGTHVKISGILELHQNLIDKYKKQDMDETINQDIRSLFLSVYSEKYSIKNDLNIEDFTGGLLDGFENDPFDDEFFMPEELITPENYFGTDVERTGSSIRWTENIVNPTLWSLEHDWTPREISTVKNFLHNLAITVKNRGVLLEQDSIKFMAENLSIDNVGETMFLLSEPWMSRKKLNQQMARHLASEIAVKMRTHSELKYKYTDGFKNKYGEEPEQFKNFMLKASIHEITEIIDFLRSINTPIAYTMATSLEYVCACFGVRASMVRVADALKLLIRENEIKPETLKIDLINVANNWLRLAYGQYAPPSPHKGYNTFAVYERLLADVTIDLTGKKGSLQFDPRVKIPEIETMSGAMKEFPAGKNINQITILNMIGASAGNSEVDESYSCLLKPLSYQETINPDLIYSELMSTFPWMSEANEYVARMAALSKMQNRPYSMSPLLIVGPAGCGKTKWAKKVGEISNTSSYLASMAGLDNSKSITGSERGWHSARPSLPVIALAATLVPNPILIVDEIDKAERGGNGDPFNAFLPMLEKETSHSYPDIYLLGHVNISHVSFVFTANHISKLGHELLDRMKIINVNRPSIHDFPKIINSMIEEKITPEFIKSISNFDDLKLNWKKIGQEILEQGSSLRELEKTIDIEISKHIWKPKSNLKIIK